jgi:16S rRNA (guanine527-N7)-methyltransferase
MFHVKHLSPVHPIEHIRLICARNGLTLSDSQLHALRCYGELLGQWNRKLNLISRRDEQDLWFAHILHSLAPWFVLTAPAGARVLDLGTGGGLPGIPLAILRGDLRVVLLDSVKKKTVALREIVDALRLENAEVRTGRAEDRSFRETFRCDLVIARAVAGLSDLIRWSRPLVRDARGSSPAGRVPPGTLIAMKGGDLESELRQARIKAGGVPIEVIDLSFEGSHEAGLADKKLILVRLG